LSLTPGKAVQQPGGVVAASWLAVMQCSGGGGGGSSEVRKRYSALYVVGWQTFVEC
jgi:hypothetical protein